MLFLRSADTNNWNSSLGINLYERLPYNFCYTKGKKWTLLMAEHFTTSLFTINIVTVSFADQPLEGSASQVPNIQVCKCFIINFFLNTPAYNTASMRSLMCSVLLCDTSRWWDVPLGDGTTRGPTKNAPAAPR